MPNNSARDLVKLSSDAVGLVEGVSNPFYSDIIKAVEREIDAAGCTMVMQQIDISEDEVARGRGMERGEAARAHPARRALGLFGGGPWHHNGPLRVLFVHEQLRDASRGASIPRYPWRTRRRRRGRFGNVHTLGHRRIAALVSETDDRSISELRYRGYAKALREFGLEPDPALVACAGSFGMRDAYEATMRLLDSGRSSRRYSAYRT